MEISLENFTTGEIHKASQVLKKMLDREMTRYKVGKLHEQREAQCLGAMLMAGQLAVVEEYKRRMLENKTPEQREQLEAVFQNMCKE